MKIDNIKTHMTWTIVILAALLIGSLSVSWSTLDEIPTIVSIALGLSSLAVAFIAIVQSLSGNSTLLSSLSKIESASQQAFTATKSVEAAALSLASKVSLFDELPQSVDAIGKKIDQFTLSASDASVSNSAPEKPEANADQAGRGLNLVEMYNDGTNGTAIAMYMAAVGHQKNRSFDPFEAMESKYISGMINGYLIALKSSGAIKADFVDGKFHVRDMPMDDRDIIIKTAEGDENEFIKKLVGAANKHFAESAVETPQ
ncbi:hypothetical protein [Brevundimonas basaltis]|uniref:Uncharacterized protein n=1 Tax=Brevundimonas basaltis TaxID=472166 RepID=A0A7W8MG51_9CAUL|nr:hypothetical protein [Brevundimonas basaltis]MBB5291269.1 hypothetical protein [Brevundimonas basaltis]